MLEQPGAHDVGGDLGKDAAFLLPLGGAVRLGIFVGCAVTRPDTVVQPVTCKRNVNVTGYVMSIVVLTVLIPFKPKTFSSDRL